MRRALALALLLVLPVGAQPSDESITWFLTGETGDIDALGLQGVQWMQAEQTGTQRQATFSSVPGIGNPLPGAPDPVTEVEWYAKRTFDQDQEVLQDPMLVLFLQASFQVAAEVRFELSVVGPDGESLLGADDRRVDVSGGQEPQEVRFPIQARGQSMPQDAVLRLRVAVEGTSVATVLLYDDAAAPSRLEGLVLRPLDSDGDGLPDSVERAGGSDPFDGSDPADGAFDQDGDGISDADEARIGTDPRAVDSDGDGWGDGAERSAGTDPLVATDAPRDRDGDGLSDAYEARSGTDPDNADTDGDGTSDCDEDGDEDGLTNCQEQAYGSDPQSADSDGDGVNDGEEVAAGTSPTRHSNPPPSPLAQAVEVIAASVMLVTGLGLAIVGLARRHRL